MFTFVGVLSFVRKYSAHTYDLGFSLIRTQQILDYYGNIQKDLHIIISLAPACFDVFSFTWNTLRRQVHHKWRLRLTELRLLVSLAAFLNWARQPIRQHRLKGRTQRKKSVLEGPSVMQDTLRKNTQALKDSKAEWMRRIRIIFRKITMSLSKQSKMFKK